MAYTRKFLILKKELGNMRATGLKGHGKLEIKGIKGMISINIENAKVNDVYGVEFISSNKSNQIQHLGKIYTDEVGRGRGNYTFTQKDFKMEDIIGVLISKDENIFLGGYINDEDGRIQRYLKSIELIETEEIEESNQPAEIEILPEVLEEEVYEEVEVKEIEDVEEEIQFDPIEPQEEFYEEYQETYKEEKIEELPIEETYEEKSYEEEIEETILPEYNEIDNGYKLNQKQQTINYVLNILRYFPYLDPFKNNLTGYNWWVVDLDRENEYRSFLPYFSYLTGGNNKESYNESAITCTELMDKYQHYIFGLYNVNEEVKYFVYGVPGSFTEGEHPGKGRDGFNTWYEGKNENGYWIIYIDPITGKPIYPFNPMIPVE